MKARPLIFSILFFSSFIGFSQNKTLHGDTTRLNHYTQELYKELGLEDLGDSEKKFFFRYNAKGQIVEIWEKDGVLEGRLINYVYRRNRLVKSWIKLFFEETKLPTPKINSIYRAVRDIELEKLKSMEEIKDWSYMGHGISYLIEVANKVDYWIKRYDTPSIRSSIPEALIILKLIEAIENSIELKQNRNEYLEALPKIGCYYPSYYSDLCYNGVSYWLGYLSSTKLPIGFRTAATLNYIGNVNAEMFLEFSYQYGRQNSSYMVASIAKGNILVKNDTEVNDVLIYRFYRRKLNFLDQNHTDFINHKLIYRLDLNTNTNIKLGVDHFQGEENETAGIIALYHWEKVTGIALSVQASLFNERIDYRLALSRHLYRGISLRISYEKFLAYHDLTLNLYMGF